MDSQFAHAHSLKIEVDLAWYNRWHSFLAHASLRVRNSPIISNQGDFCLIATYQGEIQQAHNQQNVPLHDHSTYYYVVCVSCDSAVQPEPHPQSCDWLTLQAKRPRSALRNGLRAALLLFAENVCTCVACLCAHCCCCLECSRLHP